MTPLLAYSVSYILLDVALGLTALVVGFVTALVYSRHVSPKSEESAEVQIRLQEQANQSERAAMAAQQLRSLAENMASDVGAHCRIVSGISTELGSLNLAGGDGDVINSAIAKMLEANSTLQSRLEEAEQKIATQAEEIRTQQSEARTDALTGLANRRAFDDEVRRNLATFKSEKRPFSLLIFDVDHFKKFNDTHGHPAGDEVLRCVGRTLQAIVKSGDLACRYGGEEFAVVMPNTLAQQARIAAERVRKSIEEMTVDFEGSRLSVTASVGVAQIAAGQDAAQLIRRADDAVYASKAAGRNNGHWHTGDQCLPLDCVEKNEPKAPSSPAPARKPAPTTIAGSFGERFRKLPDQRMMADELSRRISESVRFGVPLSVIRLEVEDFSQLEQTYGDAAADLILDTVVGFARSNLRDMDLLSRISRGVFAVMLPASNTEDATAVGRRICSALTASSLPLGGKQIQLAMKLGVAYAQAGDDAVSLLKRSCQAAEPVVPTRA